MSKARQYVIRYKKPVYESDQYGDSKIVRYDDRWRWMTLAYTAEDALTQFRVRTAVSGAQVIITDINPAGVHDD